MFRRFGDYGAAFQCRFEPVLHCVLDVLGRLLWCVSLRQTTRKFGYRCDPTDLSIGRLVAHEHDVVGLAHEFRERIVIAPSVVAFARLASEPQLAEDAVQFVGTYPIRRISHPFDALIDSSHGIPKSATRFGIRRALSRQRLPTPHDSRNDLPTSRYNFV